MFLIIISEPNEDILIFYSNVIMLKFLSEILFLLLPILISS